MTIGIVDAGIGNLGSLSGAFYSLGTDVKLVSSKDDLFNLTHLILPGVGSFSAGMRGLENNSLVNPIRSFSQNGGLILGICLGMQLLADWGDEGGGAPGLGLIEGCVTLLPNITGLRLPHVGWNNVRHLKPHPILHNVRSDVDFYFVHSYRFAPKSSGSIVSETEYGEYFPSVIAGENIFGVQFHPEKSQKNGLRILQNFSQWDGKC